LGGDGTISEVAGGLLAARPNGQDGPVATELGIIPRGTGGDFRRTLDLPIDIAQAAAHIRDRPARLIDAAHVHYTTADGGIETRYFINVASFGFSSAVAALTTHPAIAFLQARSGVNSFHNEDLVFPDVIEPGLNYFGPNFQFVTVPEPPTVILAGCGLVVILTRARRLRR
jgi:hypothetical protein